MLSVITNNPFRILGVYANSTQKEIIANKGRITAFAKVNRAVNFPLDLDSILPTTERTVDTVNQALASITLPAEKLKNAMFWFVNVTSIDEVAFNHITNGNFRNGLDILERVNDWSSLHNKIICYLIEGEVDKVGIAVQKLYGSYSSDFLKAIGCDNLNYSGTQLIKIFVDILFEQNVDIARLISYSTTPEIRNYINDKSIAPLIDSINKEIVIASNTSDEKGSVRYEAGLVLKNRTSNYLSILKSKLGVENVRYQMIADKLAQEILQCGIDYYNDSPRTKESITAALILQQYACDISIGRISKERCLENVNILKKHEKEIAVKKDIDAIVNELDIFDKKANAEKLLTNCRPYLLNIRQTLGSSNKLYLDISSTIVKRALNQLIETINEIQRIAVNLGRFDSLLFIIEKAESQMSIMSFYDLNEDAKSYLDSNKSSLKHLKSDVNSAIKIQSSGRYNSPQSSSGCCVVLAIAIVLFSIPFFLF